MIEYEEEIEDYEEFDSSELSESDIFEIQEDYRKKRLIESLTA